MASNVVSTKELQEHSKHENAWIVIDGDVYDVSKFAMLHPGGELLLREFAGQDATEAFYGLHRHEVLEKYGPKLIKGRLEGAEPRSEENRTITRAELSPLPFAEATAFQGFASPYWNEEHKVFRQRVRKWMHENLQEEAEAGELSGKPPTKEVFKLMGDAGLLAGRMGPGEAMKFAPKDGIFGCPVDKFDYFYEMILHEEISRLATPGYVDGCGSGMAIGLPPVLQFGPDWMKEKVGAEVLSGEKRICLAITEAFAGSDVAHVKTRAEKLPNGNYLVNGTKKWITNGHQSDYFTTLVRTGADGHGGLSFMLIPRSEGVETKSIKTAYSVAAGTAQVTFENVEVPAENLIGGENMGFLLSMFNFVHERWMICAYINAGSRGMIDETLRWCQQRKAFGKPLLSQPVIRKQIGEMISKTEAVYAWTEMITYRMCNMPYHEMSEKLAGQVCLLKYECTRVALEVADRAVQIMGGRGITQGGMGKYVERFQRTFKFASILGGSEDVLIDAGLRLSMAQAAKEAGDLARARL